MRHVILVHYLNSFSDFAGDEELIRSYTYGNVEWYRLPISDVRSATFDCPLVKRVSVRAIALILKTYFQFRTLGFALIRRRWKPDLLAIFFCM